MGEREMEIIVILMSGVTNCGSLSRVRKSKEEMDIMRYVNKISCEAHKEVMKMMKPNHMEYEGEA